MRNAWAQQQRQRHHNQALLEQAGRKWQRLSQHCSARSGDKATRWQRLHILRGGGCHRDSLQLRSRFHSRRKRPLLSCGALSAAQKQPRSPTRLFKRSRLMRASSLRLHPISALPTSSRSPSFTPLFTERLRKKTDSHQGMAFPSPGS